MIAPARVAAYTVLSSLSSGREDLPAAIARARASLADDRDRALASEIATGVQRWRAALDHVIVEFAKRPIDRLDVEILDILRLSLYQLLHLTRVPAPAVVDDAVDLSRRAGKGSASGLVNAVLRAAVRRRKDLPLPARPAIAADRAGTLDYLSVTLSHPLWLAERWLDRLGSDVAEAWMRFNNSPAQLTLRANTLRASRDAVRSRLIESGVNVVPGRFAPDALLVESGHPSGHDFVIQDEASQLVTLLAGAAPGPAVLDTCASPGGKATALAAAMAARDGPHRLVACDVRNRRIDLLRRTIASSGAESIRVVQADLMERLPFPAVFDCVIVDAPCSGLGTLRRDPDIKWRRREEELRGLAESQLRMLINASEVIKPGGRLIYATCSSEPEENEDVVDRFLALGNGFVPVDARQAHSALSPSLIDRRGHLRTSPDAHGLECFFGAILQSTVL